jgi:hypothetical protein
MDFMVAVPKTEGGYDAVLVLVDRLTKMVHLAPTSTTVTVLLNKPHDCFSITSYVCTAFPKPLFLIVTLSLRASFGAL